MSVSQSFSLPLLSKVAPVLPPPAILLSSSAVSSWASRRSRVRRRCSLYRFRIIPPSVRWGRLVPTLTQLLLFLRYLLGGLPRPVGAQSTRLEHVQLCRSLVPVIRFGLNTGEADTLRRRAP